MGKIKFTVTQNGKVLPKSKYTWNEKLRHFKSNEKNLVVDFSDVDDLTVSVGANCEVTVGSYCFLDTYENCKFKTKDHCIFNTNYGCSFDTMGDCIFNTGDNCSFFVGKNCSLIANWEDIYTVHMLPCAERMFLDTFGNLKETTQEITIRVTEEQLESLKAQGIVIL